MSWEIPCRRVISAPKSGVSKSAIYDQIIFMNVVVGDKSWKHYFLFRTALKNKKSSMAHQK